MQSAPISWTKVIREIIVAARLGGGDPDMNPRLRLSLLKARAANVPKDTVKNAILKGTGQLEGANYEEIRYEGYGVGGAALTSTAPRTTEPVLLQTFAISSPRTAATSVQTAAFPSCSSTAAISSLLPD